MAGGRREAGSVDDFYAVLARLAQAARSHYNTAHRPALGTDTYTGHLLPTEDDRKRHVAEAGTRLVRHLEGGIPATVRKSLMDGHEHMLGLETFSLGVQVRADHGHETYVAVRITGSVSDDVTSVILDIVPGCDRDGWYPENRMPERRLRPNEQAWSNIMDPTVAAKLLDD